MDRALVIYFILLAFSILAIRFALYCVKEAGEAFLYAAQLSIDRGMRNRFSRKAVVAGNKLAYPIYALSIPEEFEEHKPMKPFKFKGIKCVFSEYYFADKYKSSEDTTPNVHPKTLSNVHLRTLSIVHLITLQMYSFNQVAFWL